MTLSTERFLELVRDAEQGTQEDQDRVFAKLNASIAADPSFPLEPLSSGKALSSTTSALIIKVAGGTAALALAVGATLSWGDGATSSPAAPSAAKLSDLSPVEAKSRVHQQVLAEPAAAAAPTPAPPSQAPGQLTSPTPPQSKQVEPPSPGTKSATSLAEATPSLAAELALLQKVQVALSQGRGQQALDLLSAHQTTDHQFASERAAARILALCKLGRKSEAKQAADSFLKHHPQSVHSAAINNACPFL